MKSYFLEAFLLAIAVSIQIKSSYGQSLPLDEEHGLSDSEDLRNEKATPKTCKIYMHYVTNYDGVLSSYTINPNHPTNVTGSSTDRSALIVDSWYNPDKANLVVLQLFFHGYYMKVARLRLSGVVVVVNGSVVEKYPHVVFENAGNFARFEATNDGYRRGVKFVTKFEDLEFVAEWHLTITVRKGKKDYGICGNVDV